MITIDCPVPPSTNRLWRTANRKGCVRWYKAPEHDIWLREAWVAWLKAKPIGFKTLQGPVTIEILISPNRKRDADNSAKAACDMLQKLDIIANDSQAQKVIQEIVDRERAPQGCRITVTPL